MPVMLWAARLDRPLRTGETEALQAILPPERRERLPRQPEKRREPLCAYLLLRCALWEQYHWEELPRMAYTDRGKPTFSDHPEVCFSLSHTEGAVLAALSGGEVGVDIEKRRSVSLRMRQRLGVGESDFFQSWVRREARTKRSGRGIGAMLREEPPLEPGEVYQELALFPGYAAGVSAGEAPEKVRMYSMEELLRFASELNDR